MTNKDAYYFPHFSNARHDRKIKRIIKELGVEGYGIYFMLLEVLREQRELRYPIRDIDLLADEFKTSEAKITTIIGNYDLFNVDESHMFFSPKQIEYLQPYFDKSRRARDAANKRWNEQKSLPEHIDNTNEMQKHMQMQCTGNASKVKESIVKYIKEEVKESLRDVVFQWLEYKKERKDKQYTMMGIKQFYKKLHEYSGGDKKRALNIIENSIANNWQGIFPPKQQQTEHFIPTYERLDLKVKKL